MDNENDFSVSDISLIMDEFSFLFNRFSVKEENFLKHIFFVIDKKENNFKKTMEYLQSRDGNARCRSFSVIVRSSSFNLEILLTSVFNKIDFTLFINGFPKKTEMFTNKSELISKIAIKDEIYPVNVVVFYFYSVFERFLFQNIISNKVSCF